jgi:predicted XRE-type DNA-binding protein
MKSATRNSRQERDRRLYDTRAIASSGNVFIDLGFDEAEAHVMALRALLIVRLRERLQEERCTQVEAAKRLGMTQVQVSALLKGARRDFSMDMLLMLAIRAGLEPELHLAAEEKRSTA